MKKLYLWNSFTADQMVVKKCQNQLYSNEKIVSLEFIHWLVVKKCRSDFQSEFSMSRIIRIFLNFFLSMKNTNLGTDFFIKNYFLITSIFEPPYYYNHAQLSADGFTKFGNFIWWQLIFGQKSCFLGPRQLVRQEVNIH